MHLTKDKSLTTNSWFVLDGVDSAVPPELAALDRFAARDCGWIAQMRPFIKAYSEPDDVVLDPFAGLGTTLLAGLIEHRSVVGIEIDANRIRLIEQRLRAYSNELFTSRVTLHNSAAQKLPLRPDSVDLLLTSVPYFTANQPVLQNDACDHIYEHSTYDQYLATLRMVLSNIATWLKPCKYAIFMCENLNLPTIGFVPLAWDLARILQEHFKLLDERIICYNKPHVESRYMESTNRSHEYVLICQKTC